ncbi:hypothetical protein OPU71_14825 [Niveibacterium sp. 24ML]|uniref:hypothetical protein n=1 Tax=Niveibacterium sp. 24ML TaxID=2985512 RepID=UPI00226FBE8B|nr:hypothetical protein [Niveibacterium sp. 24ML]MCX9157399.1 hypothetical protein [Niveibacterium sp. 24ML]
MDGVHIVQARVRGAAHAPDVQARLARRVDAALGALDPGDAILCLRRAGGRIAADALERPLHRPSPDWQAVITQARSRLAAARRPWIESVGPAAEAVRFADTAEWLACAARDLLAGTIDHWWWCSLPQAGAEGVFAAWRTHPQAVPAALALLAGEGRAVAFARACAPQAEGLRQALAQCFVIPAGATPAPADAVRAIAEALADCAGFESADLPAAARAWLWLALGLARVPAAASAAPCPPDTWLAAHGPAAATAAEGMAVEDLPRLALGDEVAAPAPAALPPSVAGATASDEPAAFSAPPVPASQSAQGLASAYPPGAADADRAAGAQSPDEAPATAAPTDTAAADGPRSPPAVQWHDQAPTPPALPEQTAGELPVPELPLIPALQQIALPSRAVSGAAHAAANTAFVASPLAAVQTGLGGVFHLLNLALALGLYPDFTRPAERGIGLHPWDLLSLLARRLLGAAFDADPLATWLAAAAGRPAELQAGSWAPPPRADWCLPEDWLAPWADQKRAWRQVVGPDRHALWHPAGFCVADLPRREVLRGNDWPGWVAPRRIAQRGRPAPRPIGDWADWVARLAPFVVARLAVATGFAPDEVVGRVLRRAARIVRSGEALEVRMSLAALPIELRLAGLDRDLGWLPAAGCALRYRFTAEAGQ